LAKNAGNQDIEKLLHAATNGKSAWARRNALRVLGQFCWKESKCRTVGGLGCKMNRPCALLLVGPQKQPFMSELHRRILKESHEKPLDDALWIAGTYFKPFGALKSRYESIATGTKFSPITRVRAVQAWNLLVSVQTSQSAADIKFLAKGLSILAIPAIPRIMATTAQYMMASLKTDQKAIVKSLLSSALHTDHSLVDKINLASALDRYDGDQKASMKIRKDTATQYLNNSVAATMMGNRVTVRSSFARNITSCWLTLIQREWRAFQELLGPQFAAPLNASSHCGPINVVVFPDYKAYHSYMEAFVGFAANAGGLFIKKYKTLFTFQRTAAISYISVEELILHEFGHYLQGCYIFPGSFGTQAYNRQPKGVFDEGLAEFWATLNFNQQGCYSMPLRENYMKRICRNQMYPGWNLDHLLHDRKGYDQNGVFHYMQAYTLMYFMGTKHRDTLRSVLQRIRAGTYDVDSWESMTGKNVAEWNSLWKAELKNYCSPAVHQRYEQHCPLRKPDDGMHSCHTQGHGFHPQLWHTSTVLKNSRDLGEDADLLDQDDDESIGVDTQQSDDYQGRVESHIFLGQRESQRTHDLRGVQDLGPDDVPVDV